MLQTPDNLTEPTNNIFIYYKSIIYIKEVNLMFKHILITACILMVLISLSVSSNSIDESPKFGTNSEQNQSIQLENLSVNTSSEHIIKEGITTMNKSVDNLTNEKADILAWDYQIGYKDGLHNVDASEYVDVHKNILKRVKSEYDRKYIEAQIDSYTTGWFKGNEDYLLNHTKIQS
jgi:hypothetical protein